MMDPRVAVMVAAGNLAVTVADPNLALLVGMVAGPQAATEEEEEVQAVTKPGAESYVKSDSSHTWEAETVLSNEPIWWHLQWKMQVLFYKSLTAIIQKMLGPARERIFGGTMTVRPEFANCSTTEAAKATRTTLRPRNTARLSVSEVSNLKGFLGISLLCIIARPYTAACLFQDTVHLLVQETRHH